MWARQHTRWLEKWARKERLSGIEFWRAYLSYPAIQLYLTITVAALVTASLSEVFWDRYLFAIGMVVLFYPLVEYGLHRFVFHWRGHWRSKLGSRVWKRVHFDHHREPADLSVLFGATYTAVPTIALLTIPMGFFFGGIGTAALGFAAGMLSFCIYEWVHSMCHMNWPTRSPWLKTLRRAHLLHHYHSENGNFGIATRVADRLFSSAYDERVDLAPSGTVRNLGYTATVSKKFPWVAKMTSDWGHHPTDQ